MRQTRSSSGAAAAGPLLTKKVAVTAGRQYRFQLPAWDAPESAGKRALVCRLRFLDGFGKEIEGAYQGCFHSNRFGSFVYLPSVAEGDAPRWSDQCVRAPDLAMGASLDVYGWHVSAALRITEDLQVTVAGDSIFEQEFEVDGGFDHTLYIALSDDAPADRAAVVQVVYLDASGNELPGSFAGCNQSARFGQFIYVGIPKGGSGETGVILQVPESAVRMRLVGHRWKGTSELKLSARPRLLSSMPHGVDDIRQWSRVGADAQVVAVRMGPDANGGMGLIEGRYAASPGRGSGKGLRLAFEFMDADGRPVLEQSHPPGVLAERVHVLGCTSEVRRFACFAWCPPGTVSGQMRVSRCDGAGSALIERVVTFRPVRWLESARRLDSSLGISKRVELQRPAFFEWRLRIDFEALRMLDPGNRDIELRMSFVDHVQRTVPLSGVDMKLYAGTLRREGNALYLKPAAGASGDMAVEHLRAAIQVLPPEGVDAVLVGIENNGCSEMPYACRVHSCDAMAEARLTPASATRGLRIEAEVPDAARLMTDRLLELHPDDPKVLSGAIDVYRRLGMATRMEEVSSRALALPAAGSKLKHKARHVLASLQEQDPNWHITVPGAWQGQQRARKSSHPLRVAHLFKTSVPYENTGGAIRCLNIVKFQKQIGMDPLVVTPLGYPGMRGISGEPWERQELDGIPHYRLNGISRDDLRTIPSTRQLEYSALLIANLLREQGIDLVQASSGYRGYEQALVGLAVARKLEVPFVYEVRSYHEHTWRPLADWMLEAEFTVRRMVQENRCMREADAVVTICETMKQGLVERGVEKEKVFVVPNSIDPDRFRPAAADSALKQQLGLRATTTVGYISNLSRREGHTVLLQAVARARGRGVDVDCLIVGGGPEFEPLKLLARDLGVEEHVVFTGEVSHDEISRYYTLIDIFVVPRIADFASDFVTPMKPFEAMAMGCAVLISDRPALREVVEPGVRGAEFRAGNVEDLVAKIAWLAGSQDERERLAYAGREWVRQCRTWGTTIESYREAYEFATRMMDRQKSPRARPLSIMI